MFWNVERRRKKKTSIFDVISSSHLLFHISRSINIYPLHYSAVMSHCTVHLRCTPLLPLEGYGAHVYVVSRLQQRNQDLIFYRQHSKQGLMIPSMTNNFATAQAVYHSENKWIKTQSQPLSVVTYQCYRLTTFEENRWVSHIGFWLNILESTGFPPLYSSSRVLRK